MTEESTAPAELPPPGLDGLEARWSRLVTTPNTDGVGRTWHVLDNHVEEPTVTVLCVHGNPTWSYLWRDMIADAPQGVRVVAADHLDMGFSERTGTTRRLEQRIEDLSTLTAELDISGPVVTVAHDWGGPISLGWAQRHRDQLAGIVLMNTAVHHPEGSPAPRLIRMVRTGGVLEHSGVATRTFVRGALALSRPRLKKSVRDGFEAPYRAANRRKAIAGFVDDIPLNRNHPSRPTLDGVAAGLEQMAAVPTLLLWGPSDPVFSDRYLLDLAARLPQAEIHRFVGASHLTPEDADVSSAIYRWIERMGAADAEALQIPERAPLWAALDRLSADSTTAVVEMGPDGRGESVTFAQLSADVRRVAAGLADLGVQKGDRVALLVTPGIDLAATVYACWRMGAVVVVADAGLGLRGMSRALAGANPDYLIGVPKALAAARAMQWPGIRISTLPLAPIQKRFYGVRTSLVELRVRGERKPVPPTPSDLDVAGIGFTSGATGPAKGVVYRHHQLRAQRDALIDLYGITSEDRLVAAFGPFALFGPSMGIPSVVPDMEVTSPGSLTAEKLGQAAETVGATLVFASPAALRSVIETSDGMTGAQTAALGKVRLLMSAGAPVPARVLREVTKLMPNAEAHTPYGMTEVLPVADISLAEIEAVGAGNGVCVGYPVDGVEVAVDGLNSEGEPIGLPTVESEVVGEVCIRAAHMREGYDKLWVTQDAASQPSGWHRSGDVGHLDDSGRLWIEGRIGHIVRTASGPVTPIAIEHAVSELPDVAHAAAVGVGPPGTQQVAIVLVPSVRPGRPGLADESLSDRVRLQAGSTDVAAVLVVPSLPVDKRHNSKIDRTKVAAWAEGVLSGGRMGSL